MESITDWCKDLIKYLLSFNINQFFVASGGRSLFLLSAIAREKKAQIVWGIDERSLGFMALGYGKKNKKPGVIVTTSGTAVANLYPSVIEAFYSHVPMILLTADVPSYLRNKGANQTINQAHIFSHHLKKSLDINVLEDKKPIEENFFLLKEPIHINLQFPDPAGESFKNEKSLS